MMNKKPLVTFILGTRPEAIKLAPVILEFQKCKEFRNKVILTGQHKELIDPIFNLFGLSVDKNLNIMRIGQSLGIITSKILIGLEDEFKKNRPDLIVVQGDTTSAMVGCLAGFYNNVNIAHVEAGLRTNDLLNPFPEEANRRIISQIASLNFTPTEKSKRNLLNAGIKKNISVTGNTVIDSLIYVVNKYKSQVKNEILLENKKFILVTVHRRENWGEKLEQIAYGLLDIVNEFKEFSIIIPMHPNIIVREVLKNILGKNTSVILTEPMPYDEFIKTMYKSEFILTDSGGLQEEAPSLGKPLLILRDTTEREEAIEAGAAKIIGTNRKNIYKQVKNLILSKEEYMKMSRIKNPFGDGKASKRILEISKEFLKVSKN